MYAAVPRPAGPQESLYQEMRGRIKEDDVQVPHRWACNLPCKSPNALHLLDQRRCHGHG